MLASLLSLQKMEVKPAEFARIAGVSRPSISEKIKNKTLIINAAGMLDTDNPLNASYISKHKQRQAEAAAADYAKSGGVVSIAPHEKFTGVNFQSAVPQDNFQLSQLAGVPMELLNLTMRELVLKYPGIDKIERYAKILKETTATAEKYQRMEERNLTLVSKDFVISRVFTFLDTLVKQALEYPEAAADRIISLVQAEGEGCRLPVIEAMREGLSRVVSGAKEQVITELKTLKSKYQKDNLSNDRIEEFKDAIIEEAQNE
jgi:hypothetical protein